VGRPAQSDLTLDLSGIFGVTLYVPVELVLPARAGTPIAEIEALVAACHQQLAFEPMDYTALLGSAERGGTIGGVLGANLSGPRRLKAGAARDHFLGLTAVSGRGETFKSGGRVVKNVTGYDLCKLIAGSWGTLAAMTEVTVKTLPRPETEATVAVVGLDDATGVRAMTAAMGSFCDVSGAAHLPAAVAATVPSAAAVGAGRALTVLRLEGVAPSVAHRQASLTGMLAPFGDVVTIAEWESRSLWRAIRDVLPFAASRTGAEQPLWRVSTAPARGGAGAGRPQRLGCGVLVRLGGGLLWLLILDTPAMPARRPCGRRWRHMARDAGAAPAALRAAVEPFQPQEAGLAALTKRVKDGFDPKGVFNTGRMWAGV
jgi:glycolate oxidase FAD binding subunit